MLAIHVAAANGNVESISSELASGVKVDSSATDGATALHLAAVEGHLSAALILLDNGATIGATDCDGWTPLHEAAKSERTNMASLLLDRGANLEASGPSGARALHIACANAALGGNGTLVELLLSRGAEVEARDDIGATPLHHAAVSGNLTVMRILTNAGANVKACGNDGRTALHYAEYSGDPAVCAFLLECGTPLIQTAKRWEHPYLNLLGFPDHFHPSSADVSCRDTPPVGFESHVVRSFPRITGAPFEVHFLQAVNPESMNQAIATSAIAMETSSTTGLHVSNSGGFHSSGSLFEDNHPSVGKPDCFQDLAKLLSSAVEKLDSNNDESAHLECASASSKTESLRTVHSWVNINRRHDYNKLHDHIPSAWSGAYYVRVPQRDSLGDEHSGKLALRTEDFLSTVESSSLTSTSATTIGSEVEIIEYEVVEPKQGLLVIFPGDMKHAVFPLCAEGERISVSFNIDYVQTLSDT